MVKLEQPTTANAAVNGSRPVRGQSQWAIAWSMFRRNRVAVAGLVGLVLLVSSAILAPLLAPFEPTRLDYDFPLSPPSSVHWFGTDELGRDILSRVLWGGRESLRVGLLGVLLGLVGGVALGLISGFFGGTVDNLLQRMNDILLAFPAILLLISVVAAFGPSLVTIMLALGIAGIPRYARLVRGSVLQAKNATYVTAAQVIGARPRRIMSRHLLPNVIPPIIIYGTLDLGYAVMVTAGLSYIGLGAQPPSPEWGAMLNAGRYFVHDAWWMSVFPGLAIVLSVLFFNLLGDGLRDALDPKLRQ
jgi:ABC-type dipeptide/oligopeptide/nickel transport system permease subunit